MINKEIMEILDRVGTGASVEDFESHIMELQKAHSMGNSLVSDAEYDGYLRILKQIKPESELFERNWETEEVEMTDYDVLLDKYGMSSISTITSIGESERFKEILAGLGKDVEIIASVKENGHAVRAVYVYGELKSGSTRGRYKKGREITRHLKAILPNRVESWKNVPLLEVRGEMLVGIETFEKHLKEKNKHPLSSVTSLIRESVTDEELKYLDIVCYKIITDSKEIKFNYLTEEFKHLLDNGFKIPHVAKLSGVNSENLESKLDIVLKHFEKLLENGILPYSTDGIVVGIDNVEDFYSVGKNGNTMNGNFAMKMGKWESNVYSAVIEEVVFMPGKTYMTPKAKIEPVVTANGSSVSTVPLYNIGVMERYGYVKGETIYFKYGGEMGVTCCDYNGNSVQL